MLPTAVGKNNSVDQHPSADQQLRNTNLKHLAKELIGQYIDDFMLNVKQLKIRI